MIEKLRLRNFKGFEDLSLESLSQITLLGGENSTGKSSILESLFLFFDRGNPELILRQFAWRGLSRVYLSTDQFFAPIFYNYSLKERITISPTINGDVERLELTFSDKISGKRVNYERRVKGKAIQTRSDEKPVVNAKINLDYATPKNGQTEHSELIVTEKGLKLKDDNTTTETRKAVYVSPRVPSSPSDDAQRFGELDLKGEVDKAVDFLKTFDPRIQGLSSIFFGESSVIHADIGLSRKVPLPHLGEGLSFLLSIFLAVTYAKEGTLLIDELGTGIHHSLLPKFWLALSKAAKAFKCQIIGTTHSYECMTAAVDGLRQWFEPEFTYIRLDRKDRRISATVYSFPVFEAAMESGWEVR